MEGSYSSDFLYYMNEGGIRSGSSLGNISGSPSRMMSGPGDGTPYEMMEQEEMLYSENFPGKLCALCNLSERSTLGQGDIIKLKVADDLDYKAIEEKRTKAMLENAKDSGGLDQSPKGNLSQSRRKGRKFTSGDSEPFDELENVGFGDEPDIGLLFEDSGHFFVHINCAVWSDGVNAKAIKEEEAESKDSPSKSKSKNQNMINGVDQAIVLAMVQKCQHCKHFGASIKCKASGKFYHIPCAAASGSYLHKPTLTLVGTDSLAKVPNYGKKASS